MRTCNLISYYCIIIIIRYIYMYFKGTVASDWNEECLADFFYGILHYVNSKFFNKHRTNFRPIQHLLFTPSSK